MNKPAPFAQPDSAAAPAERSSNEIGARAGEATYQGKARARLGDSQGGTPFATDYNTPAAVPSKAPVAAGGSSGCPFAVGESDTQPAAAPAGGKRVFHKKAASTRPW